MEVIQPAAIPLFVRRLWVEELLLRRSSRMGNRLTRSLEDATIDLLPHQVEAAAFALNRLFSGGAILADEVGLGKTIEAGLVISQLWAEGRRKILIIVPAGLRRQWVEELWSHFHLIGRIIDRTRWNVLRTDGPDTLVSSCTEGPIVVSYTFGYRRLDPLSTVPWDLVVMDEAHRLRNVYRPENRMARSLREAFAKCSKLLLTATPLQNSLMELFGLVSFVDNRMLGTAYSFAENYIADSRGWEPVNTDELQGKLSGIMIRTLRRQVADTIRYTQRRSVLHKFTPFDEERELYGRVSAFLSRKDSVSIGSGQQPLMILMYRKILASSSFAVAQTLLKVIKRLRACLEGVPEIPPAPEDLETETEEEEWPTIDERSDSKVDDISPGEFRREQIEEELAELTECYELAAGIAKNAKGEALVQALSLLFEEARKKGFPEKAVIFTESRRTQRYLYDRLCEAGCEGDIVLLSGDIVDPAARHEIIRQFREECRILIATDAGAEGLNLHFCSVVVNYDLPWNPQRIEQRIGRCHRYGQRYDVLVLNFLAEDNEADKRVYDVLATKFRLFDGVFGASDEPLGDLENTLAFERRVLEIYQTCRTPAEIREAFDRLQNELSSASRNRLMDARSLLLDRFDDEVQKRFRLVGKQVRSALDRDAEIVKQLVFTLFAHFPGSRQGDWILRIPEQYLLNVPGIASEMRVCFGPCPSENEGVVALSPGHPLVDEIIREIRAYQPVLPVFLHLCLGKVTVPMKSVSSLLGRSGWWFLYKVSIRSLEEEDHLTDIIIVEEGGSPRILGEEECRLFRQMAETSTPAGKAIPPPSAPICALADYAAKAKAENLEAEVRLWCEQEMESRLQILDSFVDAECMEAEARIEKIKGRLNESRAGRREASDPEERARLRSQVTAQETRLLKEIRRTNEEIENRIVENRTIRADLERRARTTAQTDRIALAAWELVWE